MSDFILDDQPTSDTFCMECGDGNSFDGCALCDGPMCAACIQSQHALCRDCTQAIESIVIAIASDDRDHMLAEMGL